MRVVLDCNALVSAARVDGTCRALLDRVMRRHDLVLSQPILSEYAAVAERPRQAHRRRPERTRPQRVAPRRHLFRGRLPQLPRLREPGELNSLTSRT